MSITASEKEALGQGRIPRHVAIIMDGNGRWARRRGLPRSDGHFEGVNSVREVTRAASDAGVRFLSLYAFSTENWGRPQQEVDTLMHLISFAIENETPELEANNVRLKLVGDIDNLPREARESLLRSVDRLSHCTGMTLMLCLNYSSRWELTEAVRRLAAEACDGSIDPAGITADDIEARLSTYPAPDPDLLIRTGGEKRVSNFLLWQISYTELLFSDILWPDFRREQFLDALVQYQHRERRYGKTSEQVAGTNDNEHSDKTL